MDATLQEPTTIQAKARELCQFILEDANFAAARGKIEMFLENEEAKKVYRAWQEKSHELHVKGHQGVEPGEGDLAEVESLKAAVMGNPLAMDFAEAEDEMNQIFGAVTKLVQKTLQLGHMPTEEDLAEGGCCGGGSCGSGECC